MEVLTQLGDARAQSRSFSVLQRCHSSRSRASGMAVKTRFDRTLGGTLTLERLRIAQAGQGSTHLLRRTSQKLDIATQNSNNNEINIVTIRWPSQ